MVWGCFTASGVGPPVKIDGILNGEMYRAIIGNNLSEEYADNTGLQIKKIEQQFASCHLISYNIANLEKSLNFGTFISH